MGRLADGTGGFPYTKEPSKHRIRCVDKGLRLRFQMLIYFVVHDDFRSHLNPLPAPPIAKSSIAHESNDCNLDCNRCFSLTQVHYNSEH